MSESLREQLLKAGFTEKPKKASQKASQKKNRRKGHRNAVHRGSDVQGAQQASDSIAPTVTPNQNSSSGAGPGDSGSLKQARAPVKEQSSGKTSRTFTPASKRRAERYGPSLSTQSSKAKIDAAGAGNKNKVKKAPRVKSRPGSWGTRSASSNPSEQVSLLNDTVSKTSVATTTQLSAAESEQVGKLLESNAKPADSWAGEHVYRFTLQNRIQEIAVNQETRDQLAQALCGIVSHDGIFAVVSAEIAHAIRNISAATDVFVSDMDASNAEDDEHPVPDDLLW